MADDGVGIRTICWRIAVDLAIAAGLAGLGGLAIALL